MATAVLCLMNFVFSDPKSSRKLKKKHLYILTSVFNILNKVLDLRADLGRRFYAYSVRR